MTPRKMAVPRGQVAPEALDACTPDASMLDASMLDVRIRNELGTWRTLGRRLIAEQWSEYQTLSAELDRLVTARRYKEAIPAAQIAANYAGIWHCGMFACASLERRIRQIGEALLPTEGARPARSDRLRILHIASDVGVIGGHARMLQRWIGRDLGNTHSVALTRQSQRPSEALIAAASATGGAVRSINRRPGGIVTWARELQVAIGRSDIVVLHVANYDIVPFLALAGMRRRPPVVLLDHADHQFWLGAEFVDAVVSSRRSGQMHRANRRGISPDRGLSLPLCLDEVERRGSRAEARRTLGLPEDARIILTIARGEKYRPIGETGFADALVPLLRADPRALLVAIGPGGRADWSAAMRAVPGQIIMLPERPDNRLFLESADIYLDTFIFASITCLLEAGLSGLPLVTYSPFGPGCEVMGADSLGMDDVLMRASSISELHRQLRALLDDPGLRGALGARTRDAIEATHTGANWTRTLSELYGRILGLPRYSARSSGGIDIAEGPSFSDIDLFWPFVFVPAAGALSRERRIAHATELALRVMPPVRRAMILADLAAKGRIAFRPRGAAWRYMLPEFLIARLRT